jgi:hypothetical protein
VHTSSGAPEVELFGDSDEVAEVADFGDAGKVSQHAQ